MNKYPRLLFRDIHQSWGNPKKHTLLLYGTHEASTKENKLIRRKIKKDEQIYVLQGLSDKLRLHSSAYNSRTRAHRKMCYSASESLSNYLLNDIKLNFVK